MRFEGEMEETDTILFELPVEMELRKSEGGDRRIIRGYASTESMDADGEIILQNGIDFSPLLKSGYINYDHMGKCLSCGQVHDRAVCPGCLSKSGKMPIIVGYPLMAEIRDRGWWLESELLKSTDAAGVTSEQLRMADEMWALGMALKKSGSRSLAYSVEGGVLQRDGKKIRKSIVRHAAITTKPVNTEASVELFMKSQCCGRCQIGHPLYIPGHSCGDHLHKAMETTTGEPMANGASPLLKENLDKHMAGILFGDNIGCDCLTPEKTFKKCLAGAVEHLQKCQGHTKDDSINFLRKLIHGAAYKPELKALIKQAGIIT